MKNFRLYLVVTLGVTFVAFFIILILTKRLDFISVLSTIAAGVSVIVALAQINNKGISRMSRLSVTSIIIALVIISGTILLSSAINYNSQPSQTNSVPTSVPTLVATSTLNWKPILVQTSPTCNNPNGTLWSLPLPGTMLTCSNKGLVMQPTTSDSYAEVDLNEVHGSFYGQTAFRVQVQVTFQKPNDFSTSAAILVQSSQPANDGQGIILLLNPLGQWELQQALDGSTIRSGLVNINLKQPIQLTVIARDGLLYGLINGQQVVTYPTYRFPLLNSVGLVVQGITASASAILYTNFELDTLS